MLKVYLPLPKESRILSYDEYLLLDEELDHTGFNKYSGRNYRLTIFLIGKDYTGPELPYGTREIHDIRLFDGDVESNQIYKGQVIRYVRRWFKMEKDEKWDQTYTKDGYFTFITVAAGGKRNARVNLSTIKVEEFPHGSEKNLEVLLKIADGRLVRYPHEDIERMNSLD